jgi:hypothetical protein
VIARRASLLVWLFCLVASTAAAQSRRALPDSLTDREFWQFFTTMSEESGTFPSENFVSNEKTYQYVIPTLQRTLTPNGVYLGVGPEQNFTYIANLAPRLAVIFDIRRQNAMAHLMYKALFELSPTRPEFVARLFSRPLTVPIPASATPEAIFIAIAVAPASDSAYEANWKAIVDRLTVTHGFAMSDDDLRSMRRVFEAFRVAGPDISYAFRLGSAPPTVTQWHVTYAQIQTVTNADSVNTAYLANEEMYGRVRTMQRRNLIVPVVGDFAGPKAIRGVADYLKAHDAVVTAFYLSNVEQYLFNGYRDDQRFYRNVLALPLDSTSTFIRALPNNAPTAVIGIPPTLVPREGVRSPYQRILMNDSGGFRIFTASGTDSAGNQVTTRIVMPVAPPTVSSSSAFVSGIASMRATLESFLKGQLQTYQQVTAQTKTDGWR